MFVGFTNAPACGYAVLRAGLIPPMPMPPSSSPSSVLPARRPSTQQTTGLHRTMAKVCKCG